jgi:hypothetical protein
MKKVWKVMLGIVLGLVVIAVLFGVGMMARGGFHDLRAEAFSGRGNIERGPGMMFNDGFGPRDRGYGMMGYGFNPIATLIGGLFRFGFLVLVVLGIIWLVNRLRTPKPVEAPVALPAAATSPCKKCGQPLQEGWKNCPNCGRKV